MHAAGCRAHLLVVDDDVLLLGFLDELLGEEAGYQLTVRADPPDDVAEVALLSPDAIILDLVIGGTRRGWDFLAALKADPATAALPVLVCSADGRFLKEAAASLADWDCEVLPKPFDIDALLDGVTRCLQRRATVDAAPSARRALGGRLPGVARC